MKTQQTRQNDLVADAIKKARKAVADAQNAAHKDTRTSSTACAYYLDKAAESVDAAAGWFANSYQKSE